MSTPDDDAFFEDWSKQINYFERVDKFTRLTMLGNLMGARLYAAEQANTCSTFGPLFKALKGETK